MKTPGEPAIRRLSMYLRHLDDAGDALDATISSDALAQYAGTTPAQVRKDLSRFGSFGVRGRGYGVPALRKHLRQILGLEREWRVVIVGAGKIGAALAQYPGFADRGFKVVGVYDDDPSKVGARWGDVRVSSPRNLASDVARLGAEIAVLAVPAAAAQPVLDALAEAGIRAVLNFAPVPLRAIPGIALQNVNMAAELETLAYALAHAT